MGMGKALSYDGRTTVVVGHYQPPGNFMGEWGQNVPPVLYGKPHPLTLEELGMFINFLSPSMKFYLVFPN